MIGEVSQRIGKDFGYFAPKQRLGCVAVYLNQRIDRYTSSLTGEPLARKTSRRLRSWGLCWIKRTARSRFT
jgi:hypothetical protein